MSRWLVSWQQPRDQTFSLIFPWWRGATDVAGRDRITAAIIAVDEAAAREAVIEVQFGSEPVMWNFVSRRSDDWHPFTEARPREDWMVWPDEPPEDLAEHRRHRRTSMFARSLLDRKDLSNIDRACLEVVATRRPVSGDVSITFGDPAANEAPANPCKTEGCENPGAVVALSGGHYCWECLKFSSATVVLQDAPDPRVSPKTLDRAKQLRAQAEAVTERRTAERDAALSALARQALRAEIGAAIEDVQAQIHRLRRVDPEKLPFWLEPSDISDTVQRELDEVRAEDEGTPAARTECADVLAAAIHLVLAHGGDVIGAATEVAGKLRARLDLIDQGMTWDDAKAALAAVETEDAKT